MVGSEAEGSRAAGWVAARAAEATAVVEDSEAAAMARAAMASVMVRAAARVAPAAAAAGVGRQPAPAAGQRASPVRLGAEQVGGSPARAAAQECVREANAAAVAQAVRLKVRSAARSPMAAAAAPATATVAPVESGCAGGGDGAVGRWSTSGSDSLLQPHALHECGRAGRALQGRVVLTIIRHRVDAAPSRLYQPG